MLSVLQDSLCGLWCRKPKGEEVEKMLKQCKSVHKATLSLEIQKLLQKRKELPALVHMDEFYKMYNKNQIMIIVGENGCGKTTQIPQFVVHLDQPHTKGKAVACTQPRRVAAMSVAKRIADEMDVQLGRQVGYSIRFENVTERGTTILTHMTDGMLLREAKRGPSHKRDSYRTWNPSYRSAWRYTSLPHKKSKNLVEISKSKRTVLLIQIHPSVRWCVYRFIPVFLRRNNNVYSMLLLLQIHQMDHLGVDQHRGHVANNSWDRIRCGSKFADAVDVIQFDSELRPLSGGRGGCHGGQSQRWITVSNTAECAFLGKTLDFNSSADPQRLLKCFSS